MRLLGVLQVVDLVDSDIELSALDQIKGGMRVVLQLLACHDVLHHRCSHDGGVLQREASDVDGWDGTGCASPVDDWSIVSMRRMKDELL